MTKSLIDPDGFYDIITHGHNLTRVDAVKEHVDNCFDAKATDIDISFEDKGYIMRDNGLGEDDVSKLNTYCKSTKKNNNNTIGTWGLGWHAACATIARCGSDDEAESPKLYAFISKRKTTLCRVNEFKPFDKDQDETLNKNIEKVFKTPDEAKVAMEDTKGATTVVTYNGPPTKEELDSIKESLAHAYCVQIEKGCTIKVNGEYIKGKKFRYDKEDEDYCVDFNIHPTSEKNVFDLYSNSSLYKDVSLRITNGLTQKLVEKSCYKQDFFEKVKRDKTYTNPIAPIATISISVPKNTKNKNGGLCLMLNERTLSPRENIIPHNTSTQYSCIYSAVKATMKTEISYVCTEVNKSRLPPELDKCFTNENLFPIIINVIDKIYLTKTKVVKKEKKKYPVAASVASAASTASTATVDDAEDDEDIQPTILTKSQKFMVNADNPYDQQFCSSDEDAVVEEEGSASKKSQLEIPVTHVAAHTRLTGHISNELSRQIYNEFNPETSDGSHVDGDLADIIRKMYSYNKKNSQNLMQ